jgi:hypothetical protein
MKNPWGVPPRIGDIWLHCLNHTGGYYQDAPLPVSRTYQMGHSTNFGHVWVSGDLDYYYLTVLSGFLPQVITQINTGIHSISE